MDQTIDNIIENQINNEPICFNIIKTSENGLIKNTLIVGIDKELTKETAESQFIKDWREIDNSFDQYDTEFIDHILFDGFMLSKDGVSLILSKPILQAADYNEADLPIN